MFLEHSYIYFDVLLYNKFHIDNNDFKRFKRSVKWERIENVPKKVLYLIIRASGNIHDCTSIEKRKLTQVLRNFAPPSDLSFPSILFVVTTLFFIPPCPLDSGKLQLALNSVLISPSSHSICAIMMILNVLAGPKSFIESQGNPTGQAASRKCYLGLRTKTEFKDNVFWESAPWV